MYSLFPFYHFLTFSTIFSYSDIMLSQCNFNYIDLINDIETIRTISFGKFATTQINRNNDNFFFFKIAITKIIMSIFVNKIDTYLRQNKTKVCNASIYLYKQFYNSFKIILSKRFLVFKRPGIYCHELIFCKWVNLEKPRH